MKLYTQNHRLPGGCDCGCSEGKAKFAGMAVQKLTALAVRKDDAKAAPKVQAQSGTRFPGMYQGAA